MLRDPPHYLAPLKTTTTPKRLLWLMCRGYITRKRDHHEMHFQAAALGRTWWTARKRERRDTLDTFTSPDELWQAVAEWCPKGRRVVLFTYDLAEQLRLSHMLTVLPGLGWEVDKIVLERTASWCLMRSETRSLMCCDLRSWVPRDLGSIIADLHGGKPEPTTATAGSEYMLAVAKARTTAIRDAVMQIFNWIEGENLGAFRPTGSGQSFTAYRRRFGQHRLLVHDDLTRLQAERAAMYTGRAEAWRHGALRAGPYLEYDLHAAYATIGRDCAIPTRARGDIRHPTVSKLRRAMERYAVLAHVTVTTEVECIPYTVNGRTLWPTGTFTALLWDPEISLALDYADKVTVHRLWTYVREPALRDFCAYVLDHMETQTQVYGPIPQRVLKHWSRCLVGRFGLRYREWHKFGPQYPPDVRLVTYLDLDDGTQTDMLLAGTQRLLLGDMTEARESMPQIPGWIMSKCRAELWESMARCGLHNVVYVDTDSLIVVDGTANPNTVAARSDVDLLWAHKGTYPRMTIYGPRNLEVGHSRRVAGLPLTARPVAPLEFTGEVMRGVKHAMRNGELNTVVSLPRTFHITPQDLRRQHNPNGTTSPFRIEAPCS